MDPFHHKYCRFHPFTPGEANQGNTSLMNFQWVESAQGFCDEETHDKSAPNRQNLHCGFRSVWEVIRSSEDFMGLRRGHGARRGTVPITQFEVVIPNTKPMLYLLLDLSDPVVTWEDSIYDLWAAEMEAFVGALPPDVFVKFAVYPNMLEPTTDVEVQLDWSLLDNEKREAMIKVLKFISGSHQSKFFDFRFPLAEVVSDLKRVGGHKVVATCSDIRPALQAEIFTSSNGGNKFGCVSRLVNEEPLAIYAKLFTLSESTPQPMIAFINGALDSSLTISADTVHLRTGTSIRIGLQDDGIGADLVAFDGVYSGYVYPPLDHLWRIHVTVYDVTSNEPPVERTFGRFPIGRVHSVKQDKLSVLETGRSLATPYSGVFESQSLIRVTDACIDKRFISRVVDTRVEVMDRENPQFVTVSFTAPLVTGSEGVELEEEGGIGGYLVAMAYMAEHRETLINDLTHESVQVQGFIIPTKSSGKEVWGVHLRRRREATAFAMVLIEAGQLPTKSALSNIVLIQEWQPDQAQAAQVGCLIGCMLVLEIGAGAVIFVLLVTLFLSWKRNRRQATKLRHLSTHEVKQFLYGQKGTPASKDLNCEADELLDFSERIQCLPYDSTYEIPSNKLHIDRTELLGSGAFGNVYKGYVVGYGAAGAAGKVLVVAVKTMKPDMDKSYFKVMLDEVKLMTLIAGGDDNAPHPNIIRLVGACTRNIRKCQVFLATEFCSNGNLSKYLPNLQAVATVPVWRLIKWAREIASGLVWLGSKKIVHGDLAARNILLDGDLVAKVSDFGLSKQMMQYSKYAEREGEGEGGPGLLPWKWVAPEVLSFGKFSASSDVWSYGVTLWEIFSLGQEPYPGVGWSPEFVYSLEHDGLRLMKPKWASDAVYGIMASCWTWEPKGRPEFYELNARFEQMMVQNSSGLYVDLKGAAEGFHGHK